VPLVCLVGGKWTTFRSLAELAANQTLALLGRPRLRSTESLAIGGGQGMPADAASLDRLMDGIQARSGLARERIAQLVGRYGARAGALAQDFASSGDAPLRHAPDYSQAEIRHLCRETGVRRLEDLVIRRTLLAIRGRVDVRLLSELADLAAAALGWTLTRRREEWRACAATLRDRHFVDLPADEAATASGADAPLSTDSISSPITT